MARGFHDPGWKNPTMGKDKDEKKKAAKKAAKKATKKKSAKK